MLPGLKEFLDDTAPQDISLVSIMRQFPDDYEKDRIRTYWSGCLSYLSQHSSQEKRKLALLFRKFSSEEIERMIDNELQEVSLEEVFVLSLFSQADTLLTYLRYMLPERTRSSTH
jgi:hypothetical protein